MTRSWLAWLVSIGLLVGGWATAHGLAYRIIVPDADERRHLLEGTGHGYFDPAPLVALTVTLVAAGLLASVAGRVTVGRPPWLFALLPPCAFVVQERLERFLHDGHVPLTASLDPTFAVGLLLQLPFALAALVAARALVLAVHALALRRPRSGRRAERTLATRVASASAAVPRIGLLACGHGQRAPPLLALR